MKFFVSLENQGNAEGHNFGAKKMFSGIKETFLKFCLIPGGKYRIVMTRSLL